MRKCLDQTPELEKFPLNTSFSSQSHKRLVGHNLKNSKCVPILPLATNVDEMTQASFRLDPSLSSDQKSTAFVQYDAQKVT